MCGVLTALIENETRNAVYSPHIHYTRHIHSTRTCGVLTALIIFTLRYYPPFAGAPIRLEYARIVEKIPREEQMMLAQFNEVYRAYMLRAGQFAP
jgi:hypothetical protein